MNIFSNIVSLRGAKRRSNLLFFLLLATIPPVAHADAFAPEEGKTLLFVGQDADTITQYVAGTGQTPSGTMLYTSIQEVKGLTQANEYGAGPQYGDALLQYPYSAIQVGLYMVDALEKTAEGRYDANLLKLADWIKKADRPVYVRIGYEFDNPDNHYEPQAYIEAYRHVVDFLRGHGVRNAAFVWHSYCSTEKDGHAWMDWYPGDDYVDWFGVTIFNTPGQIWTAKDFLKLARGHGKPFMICESTIKGLYTRQARMDWLKEMFEFIDQENIEAFCYIDSDWDSLPMFKAEHYGDSRIEIDNGLKSLWLSEITQERYLQPSSQLFSFLGWQAQQ